MLMLSFFLHVHVLSDDWHPENSDDSSMTRAQGPHVGTREDLSEHFSLSQ